MSDRHCGRCDQFKAPDAFYAGTNNVWCRDCTNAYKRERHAAKKIGAPVRRYQHKPAPLPPIDLAAREERDAELTAQGEAVVRLCPKPYHAIDVITSGWSELRNQS